MYLLVALLVGVASAQVAPDTTRAAASPDTTPADTAAAGAERRAPVRVDRIAAELWTLARVQPDTERRRPRAVSYSDAYYTRLTIHRYGSYVMLPLFAVEYPLGQKLLTGSNPSQTVRGAHQLVAGGIGVLFAVNTVTGVWNLWEARHNPEGRTLRTIHALALLASDAGFVWTASLGSSARFSADGANKHRAVAIGSMAVATAGTALMWFFKQ